MTDKIETLNDFRTKIVYLNFEYKHKKSHIESELYQKFKELFKIPDEADIHIEYEIDGELCLTSEIRLNIHNVKGFELIREECLTVWSSNSFFSCNEPSIEYKYFFKL